MATVSTRFLIISDTHGEDLGAEIPQQSVDVILHCGDLTDGSKLDEFQTTIRMLQCMKAPIKLVIAGNHDFTLDDTVYEAKISESNAERELIVQEYGEIGEARRLFEDARNEGIILLDEGTHHFSLSNGAKLVVYASPYTPSRGEWGFQYHPKQGHRFEIGEDTDIAMTHGPPRGMLDFTHDRKRAGCSALFEAVAKARPLIHCFGHIHEGWGAKLVTWKDTSFDKPSHFTSIDNEKSPVIEKLATLQINKYDDSDSAAEKEAKLDRLSRDKCVESRHRLQDDNAIRRGHQTLLVNAAMKGDEDFQQRPWLIDIDLKKFG